MNGFRSAIPTLLLLVSTAIWGWTFVVVRDAVHVYPVVSFLALRFALATLLLLPALTGGVAGLTSGLLPGLALTVSYFVQTLGLRYTTASRAGLLTGLFVVFTPLISYVVYRQRLSRVSVAAVIGAVVGTALLTGALGDLHPRSSELFGDGLEILTAILLSVHILLLSRLRTNLSASRIALAQMASATVVFAAASGGGPGFPEPTAAVWVAVGITGTLASALAFWIQTWVQQRISAHRVSVILVAEPAFATFFGVTLAGDRFSYAQSVGAVLIVLSLLVHETASLKPGEGVSGSAAM